MRLASRRWDPGTRRIPGHKAGVDCTACGCEAVPAGVTKAVWRCPSCKDQEPACRSTFCFKSCQLLAGHSGDHESASGTTWPREEPAPAPAPEQHAGPDKLADEELTAICGRMTFTEDERGALGGHLRDLARRVALETIARLALDARCSSQTAEEQAERFDPAKRAEVQRHLSQLPPGSMAKGRG